MSRAKSGTQSCTKAEAKTRLKQAQVYLTVADLVMSKEPGEEATVATANAVLAAIAAADAICCSAAGSRFRGADHRGAADHLEQVTNEKKLASLLRDVIDLKDGGHYGLTNVQVTRATSAVRKAGPAPAAVVPGPHRPALRRRHERRVLRRTG